MNFKKNIPKISIILLIFLLIIFFFRLTSNTEKNSIETDQITPVEEINYSNPILFYGETCSHCEEVRQFIVDSQLGQKLQITQLEIYNDQTNKEIFYEIANQVCPEQVDPIGLAVPFLIDQQEQECVIGSNSISTYLLEKLDQL